MERSSKQEPQTALQAFERDGRTLSHVTKRSVNLQDGPTAKPLSLARKRLKAPV